MRIKYLLHAIGFPDGFFCVATLRRFLAVKTIFLHNVAVFQIIPLKPSTFALSIPMILSSALFDILEKTTLTGMQSNA